MSAPIPGIVINRRTSGAVERVPSELALDELDLDVQRVVQLQVAVDLLALVRGQLELREPSPAGLAEHVGDRRLDEVAGEHGVDLIAQPGALTHQARAVRDPAPQRARDLVGRPPLRHEVRAASCASTLASTLSVLTFAEAIARVRIGLETVTRPAWAASSSAIAHVIAVDSNTT